MQRTVSWGVGNLWLDFDAMQIRLRSSSLICYKFNSLLRIITRSIDIGDTVTFRAQWPEQIAVQVWNNPLISKKVSIMAKGQVRSNREVRKPKKDKAASADKAASPVGGRFATQIKDAEKQKKWARWTVWRARICWTALPHFAIKQALKRLPILHSTSP